MGRPCKYVGISDACLPCTYSPAEWMQILKNPRATGTIAPAGDRASHVSDGEVAHRSPVFGQGKTPVTHEVHVQLLANGAEQGGKSIRLALLAGAVSEYETAPLDGDRAEADLRTLLAIPGNYKVLFLQGGAVAENAIVRAVLGPDIDVYDTSGAYAPDRRNFVRNAYSVGIAFSAVTARF